LGVIIFSGSLPATGIGGGGFSPLIFDLGPRPISRRWSARHS